MFRNCESNVRIRVASLPFGSLRILYTQTYFVQMKPISQLSVGILKTKPQTPKATKDNWENSSYCSARFENVRQVVLA